MSPEKSVHTKEERNIKTVHMCLQCYTVQSRQRRKQSGSLSHRQKIAKWVLEEGAQHALPVKGGVPRSNGTVSCSL